MDPSNFWEDDYFHLLFDDSTPSLVETIIEENQDPILSTGFQFASSSILVGYVDNVLALYGTIYVDPHY